jgi:hypothetical protein
VSDEEQTQKPPEPIAVEARLTRKVFVELYWDDDIYPISVTSTRAYIALSPEAAYRLGTELVTVEFPE